MFEEKKLLTGIFLIIIGALLNYIFQPFVTIGRLIQNALASQLQPELMLQLLAVSIVLLFLATALFLFYSRRLQSRYNHKRIYRFGVYWYKHKPYCPFCGNKLNINESWDCFDCPNCEERILPVENLKRLFPNKKIKEIVETIKKET